MPKEGYKSITLSEDLYDRFEKQFQDLKSKQQLPNGVSTLAGFFNYKISKQIDDTEKLKKIALQIKHIPKEFLEQKFLVKSQVIKS